MKKDSDKPDPPSHACRSIVVSCMDFRLSDHLTLWMLKNCPGGFDRVAIAGSVVAAAAALAGAYFLYGAKEGPTRRKKIKAWVLKMKADLLEEMENMKDLNEEVYHRAVEAVARNYEKVKDATPEEIASVVRELDHYLVAGSAAPWSPNTPAPATRSPSAAPTCAT